MPTYKAAWPLPAVGSDMDTARCRCPQDSTGAKCGHNAACPIHGYSAPNPLKPYVLSENDRRMLTGMRIGLHDASTVWQADQDRFGNPPRQA